MVHPAIVEGGAPFEPEPDGYTSRLTDQATRAIALRETRVAELIARRALLDSNRLKWVDSRERADELLRQLRQTYLQAEDTGNWPIRVSGYRFGQLEAESAITKVHRYLDGADRAVSDLEAGIDRADQGVQAGKDQITELRNLQAALPVGSRGNSLSPNVRFTEDRIALVVSRWSDLPEPNSLVSSNSTFAPLDLGSPGK